MNRLWIQEWKVNGILHRDGGLLAKIKPDGEKRWFQHGKLHRRGDLPAVDDVKEWWINGEQHREMRTGYAFLR